MFQIFEWLTQFIVTQDRSSSCDDFVDRLNRKYTVILLLVFITVLSSKQYIGEPMACFCPAHFTGAHVEYTNNICWISRSFYVPIETSFSWSSGNDRTGGHSTSTTTSTTTDDPFNRGGLGGFHNLNLNAQQQQNSLFLLPQIIGQQLRQQQHDFFNSYPKPPNTSHLKFARIENLIPYYPFLLLAQAILFYVPYFFWKNVINRSAYDIGTLIYIAYDSQYSENQTIREKTLRYVIRHMDRANDYYSVKERMGARSGGARSLFPGLSHFGMGGGGGGHGSSGRGFSSHFSKHEMAGSVPYDMSLRIDDFSSYTATPSDSPYDTNTTNTKFNKIMENLSFNKLQKRVKVFEKNNKDGDDTAETTTNDFPPTDVQEPTPQNFHTKNPRQFTTNHMALSSRMFSNQHFYSKILFTIYMLTKIFYIINCLGQFILLNKFIAGEFRNNKLYNQENDDEATGNVGAGMSTTTTTTTTTTSTRFNLQNLGLGGVHDFLDSNQVFTRNEMTYETSYSIYRGFEFGYKSLINLIKHGYLFGEKTNLLVFHTVVFCDFKIRMLGDRLHRHTVQCVLPINIYTEKIFSILWFWLLVLNFINIYNFFKWLAYYFSSSVRLDFLSKHLLKNDFTCGKASSSSGDGGGNYLSNNSNNTVLSFLKRNSHFNHHNSSRERKLSANFSPTLNNNNNNSTNSTRKPKIEFDAELINSLTHNYLMHDNIFIIKLISKNTNELITRELVTLLLENYKRKTTSYYEENTV
jgi:hypothetical protein